MCFDLIKSVVSGTAFMLKSFRSCILERDLNFSEMLNYLIFKDRIKQ